MAETEVHPGMFEKIAKMTRLGSTNSDVRNLSQTALCNLVRIRTVHPSTTQTSLPDSRLRTAYTGSDTDTPRPSSYRSYHGKSTGQNDHHRMFYREPFPDGLPLMKDLSLRDGINPGISERADLERWRNKQWHREKLLSGKEKMDEVGNEKRRRVYTRRERDQMRHYRLHQQYAETMSDIEYRHGSDFGVGRRETQSGYSTAGSMSNDELKLGRNMRAAPRHLVDSRDRMRSSPAVRDKDLIERLNRQQQLLQQQRDQRRKYLLEAQGINPDSNPLSRSASVTSFKDEKSEEVNNKTNRFVMYGGNALPHESQQKENGTLTPKSEVCSENATPVMDQLLQEGRASVQSVKPSEHSTDFFDNNKVTGEGLFQYEGESSQQNHEKKVELD